MTTDLTYRRLMQAGAGDAFDRHVFACAIALAASEPERPLNEALGLSGVALRELFAAYFPREGALPGRRRRRRGRTGGARPAGAPSG